jgi:hypothetical protein
VPVPPALLDPLGLANGIHEAQACRGKERGVRLWPWIRMTGWRAAHAVMDAAGLSGPRASTKGPAQLTQPPSRPMPMTPRNRILPTTHGMTISVGCLTCSAAARDQTSSLLKNLFPAIGRI